MGKYYFNIDSGVVESIDVIRSDFDELRTVGSIDESISFPEYLRNCMYWNNGNLETVSERMRELSREVEKREQACQLYGIDDDLDELRSELSELERLYLET